MIEVELRGVGARRAGGLGPQWCKDQQQFTQRIQISFSLEMVGIVNSDQYKRTNDSEWPWDIIIIISIVQD